MKVVASAAKTGGGCSSGSGGGGGKGGDIEDLVAGSSNGKADGNRGARLGRNTNGVKKGGRRKGGTPSFSNEGLDDTVEISVEEAGGAQGGKGGWGWATSERKIGSLALVLGAAAVVVVVVVARTKRRA